MAQPAYTGGSLRVASADQTAEAQMRTRVENAQKKLDQESPQVVGLVAYLISVWDQNRQHRETSGVSEQLLKNLRARDNEYSETKSAEIKEAGMPDVFMGLTNVKCSHAESWLMDIFSSSMRSWGLEPTPVPDLTTDVRVRVLELVAERVQQMAQRQEGPVPPEQVEALLGDIPEIAREVADIEVKQSAQNMEDKIYDQLVEGKWEDAFEDFVSDLVTLKAGIIKGPIIRNHKRIEWPRDPDTGQVSRKVRTDIRPEFERVSPFDMYPSPGAVETDDGSLVEKIRLSRADLVALKGEPGYDADAIDSVLEGFVRETTTAHEDTIDQERDDLEDKDQDKVDFKESIDGLEFWCPVQGQTLIEYGVDKIPGAADTTLKTLDEYEVNAIVVGTTLIYINLNDDELGHRPYSKTGWRKIPGSFWFKGVPELMEDLQRICNASIRSMVYNMSLAAGPQVDVDMDRAVPGEDVEAVYPGKVWQTLNRGNVSAPAVRFFQPDSNAPELFRIYEQFAQLADDYTGIPAYAFGSDRVAGAGRTSSGLSMLMTSAAKGIKRVIIAIDQNIFKTVVRRQFDWNMQYDEDAEIKGDINVVTIGAVAVMVKEQMSERRMQFLQATNNDIDNSIMGKEGRANILREAAESLEMEGTKVIPSPEDVRAIADDEKQQQQKLQQAQAQAQEAEAQLTLQGLQLDNQMKMVEMGVKQQEAALAEKRLALEAAKLMADIEKSGLEAEVAAEQTRIKGASAALDATKAGIEQIQALTDQENDEIDQAEAEVDTEGAKK